MTKGFSMTRDFIEIKGDLYEVLRILKESDGPVIDVWKEHLMANKVFRKDEHLFFCRKVEEAEIIEESSDEEIISPEDSSTE